MTAALLTKASGLENSDSARGAELIAADKSIGDQKIDALGDSAYSSGELLNQITTAGHTPIIKSMPLDRAVPGGFTVDDCTINDEAQPVTCSASIVRLIRPRGRVIFGRSCQSCPLMAQCTTAQTGRKLVINRTTGSA